MHWDTIGYAHTDWTVKFLRSSYYYYLFPYAIVTDMDNSVHFDLDWEKEYT
jgi:hypothetical protein